MRNSIHSLAGGERAVFLVLQFLLLMVFGAVGALAQAAPPLGSGSPCYWAGVWPPGGPTFPNGAGYIKGCVSTDVTAAADCWVSVLKPTNPNLVEGMACSTYPNSNPVAPFYCGTGGSAPPDYKCGVSPPLQCTYRSPQILDATDANCTTFCATGYLDGNGNCTTPPKGLAKREPINADCDDCAATNDAESPTANAKAPRGMAAPRIYPMHVSLNVSDIPVGYQPPIGPSVFLRLSYNQKDTGQPGAFTYYNLGPRWTLNTVSFVTDDPAQPGKAVTRYVAGGGHVDYTSGALAYNAATGAFAPERSSRGTLYRIPATGAVTSYELRFPSGAKHVYGRLDGAPSAPRRVFLTKIVDPQGNALTLTYDTKLRVTTLTDAIGRKTKFIYGNADSRKVTRITDPFGRFADLAYDGGGNLARITDTAGVVSSFGYTGSFLNTLTTPYGTTTFRYNETPATYDPTVLMYEALEQTDALGNTRRVVFRDKSPLDTMPSPLPYGVPVAGDYGRNNTFVWDEHAYPLAITKDANGNVTAENASKARLTHWLKNAFGSVASVPGAVKAPLERHVFFNYPGQVNAGVAGTFARPTAAGRVLDDGASQVTKATYNALGNPLTVTDAKGRVTSFAYAANNIDVLTVKQGATTIATFGNYTAQHRPQTYTDAAGKVWSYTYNAVGQLTRVTDPNGGATQYAYDTSRRLTTVTNANNAVTLKLTYDTLDRVQTRTDSEGHALTYAYDDLDRVTRVTYPDWTHDDYDWNFPSGPNAGKPSLDLWQLTDRLGRVTRYEYDANRRLTSITEDVDSGTTRTTRYSYYENGVLKDQTDANGNVTHYDIDVQGRPTAKTYAHGAASATTEAMAYETTTSRLKTLTDALGQVKTYGYALDDRLTGITYANAANPTPNVSFAYDPVFPRRTSMTDGTGTTTFTYVAAGTNGALKLAGVDGPYANDAITYTYDALGRMATRAMAGGSESFAYDALGRLTSHATGLGTFTYGYLGQTAQAANRALNGTGIATGWIYDTNGNDRRLLAIAHPGVTRSYALTSNPYQITAITDTAAAMHPWLTQTHGYTYDLADRLLTASQPTPGNNAYGYDLLDNATAVTSPGGGKVSADYNELNQLTAWGANAYSYDANGNTLGGDGKKTYKWDAENRLKEIAYVGTGNKTVFTYDGLNRRVSAVETVGGTTSTTRYLWCDEKVCQSRNGSDVVQRRHFDEGELNAATGQKLVYMQDQLGSVRDVLDGATGNRVQSYDYGPYGDIVRSVGTANTDYRYAGLFHHPASGLNLATYRAQDPITGRWINRDPIREAGGVNLYGYVGAKTLTDVDQLGFEGWSTGSIFVNSTLPNSTPPEQPPPPLVQLAHNPPQPKPEPTPSERPLLPPKLPGPLPGECPPKYLGGCEGAQEMGCASLSACAAYLCAPSMAGTVACALIAQLVCKPLTQGGVEECKKRCKEK